MDRPALSRRSGRRALLPQPARSILLRPWHLSGLPVLLVSGYAPHVHADAADAGIARVLEKPEFLERLPALLREVIDATAPTREAQHVP